MNENEQRDEWARIIMDEFYPGPQDDPMTWPAQVWRLADAIVERIKPRTITTVEELDALPNEALVLTEQGGYWASIKRMDGLNWWKEPGAEVVVGSEELTLPATVIHEPEAEATR